MAYLLTLNTGSSSVKFRLFDWAQDMPLVAGGKVSNIGQNATFSVFKEDGIQDEPLLENGKLNHEQAIKFVFQWLSQNQYEFQDIRAVAHRIVHGGEKYSHPIILDAAAISYLRSLEPLAPLHQPHNLAGIDILAAEYPDLIQYGCFDTAFHSGHSPIFHEFALPSSLRDKGIKRYGFHGLSYEWVMHEMRKTYPEVADGRIIAAHLGNGASLCAIKAGESVDTTMGMTALDGLPMGTRCGAIDAGALIYMLKDLGISLEDVENALYHESGLKGLSGVTNDVEELLVTNDDAARFALDFFVMKVAQYIAAMAVSIGGLDMLVFTGGIGENAAPIRKKILEHLSFLPDFQHVVVAANEERSMALSIYASNQGGSKI